VSTEPKSAKEKRLGLGARVLRYQRSSTARACRRPSAGGPRFVNSMEREYAEILDLERLAKLLWEATREAA
jgi:hypothetical protein